MTSTDNTAARPAEITWRVILLSICLALLLAMSNAYLALKIGILTSASIPAAVLSMGILRLFRHSSILENNLVQTAASAGEAVAGGIVYTIPALIIIHYWSHFPYWENVLIALLGGVLGVLFSIPIRRYLVTEQSLPFPEGRAVAEVLQAGAKKVVGLRELLLGGALGGLLEFLQTGLQVISSSFQYWFVRGSTLYGFGGGFSATLIGAGYLIGFNIGLSLLIGALIGWLLSIPILSTLHPSLQPIASANQAVMDLWGSHVRYFGIGAMLMAGVWTLSALVQPLLASLRTTWLLFTQGQQVKQLRPLNDRDIPGKYVVLGVIFALIALYFLFQHLFPLAEWHINSSAEIIFLLGSLLYVLVIGFIFSGICGYFSGLVGVTTSPGSAIVIAGLLLAALMIRTIIGLHPSLDSNALMHAAAMVIIIGAVITGISCIANDNIQDLKVGYLLGATPWKQQLMLLLGVVVAAAIIPPVMELLFNVYGIGGVFPHPGMDPSQMLAAPPAALMAAITQGVFHHDLPWDMILLGAFIALLCIIINQPLKKRGKGLSILGIAIGIYLPLTSSIPLFIGGLFAWLIQRRLQQRKSANDNLIEQAQPKQRCLLLACGLVSGAALMDVALAVPFALKGGSDALKIMPDQWSGLALVLGVLSIVGLGGLFYRTARSQ